MKPSDFQFLKNKRIWIIIILAFFLSVFAISTPFGLSFNARSIDAESTYTQELGEGMRLCPSYEGGYYVCTDFEFVGYVLFVIFILTFGFLLMPISFVSHVVVFIALLWYLGAVVERKDLKKRKGFLVTLLFAILGAGLLRLFFATLTLGLF